MTLNTDINVCKEKNKRTITAQKKLNLWFYEQSHDKQKHSNKDEREKMKRNKIMIINL